MQWTGLNELREKYLSFFESKGHLRLDSFPLVPKNDPSLLLINSGMAPMKKWFLAQEEPPRHRVTTCQKCIRTPDIEQRCDLRPGQRLPRQRAAHHEQKTYLQQPERALRQDRPVPQQGVDHRGERLPDDGGGQDVPDALLCGAAQRLQHVQH